MTNNTWIYHLQYVKFVSTLKFSFLLMKGPSAESDSASSQFTDENLSQKFAILIDKLGINYAKLASVADLGKPDKLYRMKAGKSNLSFNSIKKIVTAFPQTNVNFLFGTEENPLRTKKVFNPNHPMTHLHRKRH